MKKIIYIIFLFFPIMLKAIDMPSGIKETDPTLVSINEMKRLDHLISITEKNLTNQKNVKKLLIEFQNYQIKYLENSKDKTITLQMVKSAHNLLEAIKSSYLTQSFDSEFISQLQFYSQFALKA